MGKRDVPASYKVGYGKPPKKSRFKKGASGNPQGRPKGSLNLRTIIQRALSAGVTVVRGEQATRVSALEAMVLALLKKSLSGDAKATKQLLELWDQHGEGNQSSEGAKLDADDLAVLQSYIEQLKRRNDRE